MKDQEPRSAFDIPGFLEGKTRIKQEGSGRIYFIKNDVIFFRHNDCGDTRTVISGNELLGGKWFPVPEPKPKMYRHTYKSRETGDGSRFIHTVETAKTWDEWKVAQTQVTLIKTEEVGE